MTPSPALSLVIPCYNEEGNLRPLIAAIRQAVEPLKLPYEIVVTDDCSKDKSWAILKELAAEDPRICVQRFKFNCGESAASWAGLKAARGRYLVTLDADLQNDPKDLPRFLEALRQYDCVCGTRSSRADRATPSSASRRHGLPTGCETGCPGSRSAMRVAPTAPSNASASRTLSSSRECIASCRRSSKSKASPSLRFPSANSPRFAGQSHYGVWNRLFASFYDLLAVRWMKKRMFRYQIAERMNLDNRPLTEGGSSKSG